MLAYIEAKVRFKKQLENGKIKDVVEPYLVKADSFTEAEARVTKEVTPYISGEFSVAAVLSPMCLKSSMIPMAIAGIRLKPISFTLMKRPTLRSWPRPTIWFRHTISVVLSTTL